MLSAETEAWRMREEADLFIDSGSEEAEWNVTTRKRTLVWRQSSEPGSS